LAALSVLFSDRAAQHPKGSPMRLAITAVSLALTAGSAFAAEVAATSRVDTVTVFPSGAEVSRLAKVKLENGSQTIVLNDLPADAIDGSIRVEGKATGRLEIGSVDTRRLLVPRTDPAVSETERRKIEDDIEALRDQKSIAEAQLQSAEIQKSLITNLTQLPTRPAPAQGADKGEDWAQILTTIANGSADAHKAFLDAQVKVRALDRQITDLEKKLASIAPAQEERTEVKIAVDAGEALEADLTIKYQVYNASWRPLYDARLTTGDKATAPHLTLIRRADITQNTGDKWEDVTLFLSTTRPNAGASAPELQPMIVDFEVPPPPPPPVAAAPTAGYDGDVRMKRRMDDLAMAAPEAAMAEAAPIVEQAAKAVVAPFQAVFGVPGRVTVGNNGEAKRVQLTTESIEPSLTVKTTPKYDDKAYLYAKFNLPAGTPLLPGQVALFRDGTFTGNGALPILTPGEEHQLGFGIDDLVRVKYALIEEKRGETGLISTSKTDSRLYKVTVKNMHARAIPVTVNDQLPVSQNQDIKVELTSKLAPTEQNVEDKRGVLAWDMKLEPDQEQVIEFGYRVTWPNKKQVVYR
jgi:uncharacterized protein (TIGR02231 family)